MWPHDAASRRELCRDRSRPTVHDLWQGHTPHRLLVGCVVAVILMSAWLLWRTGLMVKGWWLLRLMVLARIVVMALWRGLVSGRLPRLLRWLVE